jgi:riboflavin biosynthesis pyrimidine reductase
LKDSAARDLSIGGPTLAATALRAGLVDRLEIYVTPVVVGGGTRALPDDVRLALDLVEERRFGNGMVFLCYRTRT